MGRHLRYLGYVFRTVGVIFVKWLNDNEENVAIHLPTGPLETCWVRISRGTGANPDRVFKDPVGRRETNAPSSLSH